MTFRWRALLVTAVDLAQAPGATEREYRTAINRAYYAAFGETRDFVTRHGFVSGKGSANSHQRVWSHLRGRLPKSPFYLRAAGASIAAVGEALKDMRVLADYRPTPNTFQRDAEVAIAYARRIIRGLDGLP